MNKSSIAGGLLLALMVGVVLLQSSSHTSGSSSLGSSAAVSSAPTATPTVAPTAKPTATPQPVNTGTLLPGDMSNLAGQSIPPFGCVGQSVGSGSLAKQRTLIHVRAGNVGAFDRFVMELDGPTRATVSCQDSPDFDLNPSGGFVTLKGNAGVAVNLYESGAVSFPSQTFNLPVLLEGQQTTNQRGTVSWGLGLQKKTGFRAFWSGNDLFVDISH